MQSIARASKSHLRIEPNTQISNEFNGLNDRCKLISFSSNSVKEEFLLKLTEYWSMDLLGNALTGQSGLVA
jgi:hypothetical protein